MHCYGIYRGEDIVIGQVSIKMPHCCKQTFLQKGVLFDGGIKPIERNSQRWSNHQACYGQQSVETIIYDVERKQKSTPFCGKGIE